MSFHFVKKATKSTIEQTGRRSIGFLTFALECMFNCVQSLLLFYFSAQVHCAACKTSSVTNTVYAERAAALQPQQFKDMRDKVCRKKQIRKTVFIFPAVIKDITPLLFYIAMCVVVASHELYITASSYAFKQCLFTVLHQVGLHDLPSKY